MLARQLSLQYTTVAAGRHSSFTLSPCAAPPAPLRLIPPARPLNLLLARLASVRSVLILTVYVFVPGGQARSRRDLEREAPFGPGPSPRPPAPARPPACMLVHQGQGEGRARGVCAQ